MRNEIITRTALRLLRAWEGRGHAPGAPAPAPSAWGLEIDGEGRLALEGCPLDALAERYGTPLHVVSRSRLEAAYRAFREAFASRHPSVEVAYSYKTNPLPGVLRVLHGCGAAAEVISHFELWLALRLGVPPDRILFNGPAKTADAIDLAVRSGIRLIHLDGFAEIERVAAAAARHGIRQPVGIRVVTRVGWSSQFGFRLADGSAAEAVATIRSRPQLALRGLHLHLGTGLHTPSVYLDAVREALAFARSLPSDLRIAHFDFGGGFGVPTVRELSAREQRYLEHGLPLTAPDGSPSTLEAIADGIASLLREQLHSPDGAPPQLVLEPGRALTSAAQCLLVRVLTAKAGDRYGPYVIVDGGRNLAVPLGYEYHALLPVRGKPASPRVLQTVFGPLCHPHDVVARCRELPRLEPGDVLAIMDAGAYFIPNQSNFSHPRAPVAMIDNGRPALIRERESFEDVVRLDAMT